MRKPSEPASSPQSHRLVPSSPLTAPPSTESYGERKQQQQTMMKRGLLLLLVLLLRGPHLSADSPER